MILIKLTDPNSNNYYIADGSIRALDDSTMRFWYPRLASISPVQMRPDKVYGGMVRISGTGKISISPEATIWPVPLKLTIDVRFMDAYGIVTKLFVSTGYINEVNDDSITYTLYQKEYDIDTLDPAPDLESDINRVYPIGFGSFNNELAMRVGVGGITDYHYYKASIVGTDPSISGGNYDVRDNGVQKDKYTVAGNGTVVDSVTYFKSVLASDGTTINQPYGDIRISGTGPETDLDGLFDWAKDRINAHPDFSGYSLDTSNSRSPSPVIEVYLVEQINLFDFLSEISSFFTHCFYIDEVSKIIYLIDMFTSNGTLSLSKNNGVVTDFFSATYKYPAPIKKINSVFSEWKSIINKDGYPGFFELSSFTEVICPNSFGIEETIDSLYSKDLSTIEIALINIGILKQAPMSILKIPYDLDTVVPGESYNWEDTKMLQTSSISIRSRTINYDPLNYQTVIDGEAYG
jgi:hypothetical protein